MSDWSSTSYNTTCIVMLSNQSAVCADRASASEKVPLLVCFFFFSFSIEHTVVFFFFFSPNPVKLFLRANQCLHTSAVQLINEAPLILLLSAFFVSLFLLPSSSSSALSHHIPSSFPSPSLLPFLLLFYLFLLYLNLVAHLPPAGGGQNSVHTL